MRFIQSRPLFLATILFVVVTSSALAENQKPASTNKVQRPSTWAIKVDNAQLKNFYSLSTNFYRGAQPSKEGMNELNKLGIKTVINLRGFHSDKRKIGKLELNREHFRFNTWHAEDEDVIGFLKVATDTNRWPIFVHCMHGSDRTGMMCAMYRMTVSGWTREEAIREMTQGGYGFHPEWQNLIHYLEKVDVDKIRKAAGIGKPSVEKR